MVEFFSDVFPITDVLGDCPPVQWTVIVVLDDGDLGDGGLPGRSWANVPLVTVGLAVVCDTVSITVIGLICRDIGFGHYVSSQRFWAAVGRGVASHRIFLLNLLSVS